MLQSLSPRLAASHKVAGSTSKVGKRVMASWDPPKRAGHNRRILAQLFGGFGAGPRNRDERALKERGADRSHAPSSTDYLGPEVR
jgi:hypothetical protein